MCSHPSSTLFPYTTLFRSKRFCLHHRHRRRGWDQICMARSWTEIQKCSANSEQRSALEKVDRHLQRSEEHTSELQSHHDLVCRLLLEKKKTRKAIITPST